jgi:hypothetical protein
MGDIAMSLFEFPTRKKVPNKLSLLVCHHERFCVILLEYLLLSTETRCYPAAIEAH